MTPQEKFFLDAAIKGDATTLEALLKEGVGVNAQDSRGLPTKRTALMHAAENGHLEIVDLLIKAGAKINLIDKGIPVDCPGGNTALILAIQKGHVAIANLLLDAGASPKTKGGGTSVINSAAYLGDMGLIKRVIELGGDPLQPDGSGFAAIASAVNGGNLEATKLLLKMGIDANTLTPDGAPLLITSVCDGNLALCKVLVNGGADPELADIDGITPLMTACRAARKEIVQYLLSLGVSVNKRDAKGRTCLDIIEWMRRPPDLSPEIIQRRIAMGESVGPPPEQLEEIAAVIRSSGGK